ncbi:MAG: homocysteine S-methyltransferase family protein [Rudaea sp.]
MNSGQVLVADGATGTNYQFRGLPRGMAPEEWLFECPEQVVQLHRDFIDAGANIILTDTFGATRLRLEHAGLQDRTVEVNKRAVELARQAAADRAVWVAGSMGPTGALLEPYGPLSFEDAVAAYAEQAKALAEAGVDLLVTETHFDMNEAKAAIEGARKVTDLPLVCSFSYDMGTRTMMGLQPEQVAKELNGLAVDLVGVNCGRSLDQNLTVLEDYQKATDKPLWMKPNAGLPRMTDEDVAVYDVTPEAMGAEANKWIAAGARVVGGCCGTSPEHLGQIARAAQSR